MMPHLSARVHSALLMDLLIVRMLECLKNMTKKLKISKNIMKISKYVNFFAATSKLQGETLLKMP